MVFKTYFVVGSIIRLSYSTMYSNFILKELFEVKEGTPRVYVKAKEKEENMPEIKMSKVAKRKGKK